MTINYQIGQGPVPSKVQFKSIFKPKEPEVLKLKLGHVLIEWRCKDRHPGCEATSWQPWGQVPESEAAERVRDFNVHSSFFRYRINL